MRACLVEKMCVVTLMKEQAGQVISDKTKRGESNCAADKPPISVEHT